MTRCPVLLQLAFAALALVFASPPARAADEGGQVRQFADVVYTIPDGWRGYSGDGSANLFTDDDDRFPVDCTLEVYPSVLKAEFDGDLEACLRARMAADLAEAVEDDDDTEVFGPERSDRLTVGEAPGLAIARGVVNGRRRMELYFAVDRPTRYAIARFVAPARDEEAAAAVSRVITESVEPFLQALRFVGEDAEPLLGPPTRGELDGVWWGNGVQPRYGIGGMQLKLVTAAYTFYKDGRFHRGVPEEGPEAFDFDRMAREATGRVGNYRVEGEKVVLSYADGKTRSLHYHPASRTIREHPVTLQPARVPPDGFTFEGRRTRTHYTSFATGVGSTGGVGGSHTWVYKKDGTFTHDGFVSVAGGFDDGGGFAGSSKENDQLGRYRVRNGKLETTEADKDGQPVTKRTTILLFDGGDGEPPEILVGGDFIKPLKEDD